MQELLKRKSQKQELFVFACPILVDYKQASACAPQKKTWEVDKLNIGVPHAVLFVPNLKNFPVKRVGAALRRHATFAPQGTNVNFAATRSKGLVIRTYERGVEDETLACGSGIVAAALLYSLRRRVSSPIAVKTRGGDTLRVYFKRNPQQRSQWQKGSLWLEGPVRILFSGSLNPQTQQWRKTP